MGVENSTPIIILQMIVADVLDAYLIQEDNPGTLMRAPSLHEYIDDVYVSPLEADLGFYEVKSLLIDFVYYMRYQSTGIGDNDEDDS